MLERETDHSALFTSKVKNERSYTSVPPCVSMACKGTTFTSIHVLLTYAKRSNVNTCLCRSPIVDTASQRKGYWAMVYRYMTAFRSVSTVVDL